ncbi:uncharacterized protein METZ01_LOCUS183251 [marine metagenome]|uniref:Uncharacterized protein n=1 Tax=marine metagenome TaxID=408172 RepID=A0A382CYK5_9ZZZZ
MVYCPLSQVTVTAHKNRIFIKLLSYSKASSNACIVYAGPFIGTYRSRVESANT